MTYLPTSAQIRAVEAAAIASGEVTGRQLMERAGAAVAATICRRWPQGDRPAVVLCGPGNNGGDGYVVARHLAAAWRKVRVFALAPPATPDAVSAAADWPGPVTPLAEIDWADLAAAPLVVDAMFGTGLVRDVAPGVWGALAMAQGSGCPVIAVDILSGLCADSGRVRSADGYLDHPASLTVTFDSPRPGHVLADGGWLSGPLEVADIGIGRWREAWARTRDTEIAAEVVPSAALSKLEGHKYDHGHALILSGGPGRGGAARLAARSALRVGAGLATLGCPPAALAENAARLDAVMLRPVGDAAALDTALADRRVTAMCLGPGLGLSEAEARLVAIALGSGRAAVLDADALTLIAQKPPLFAALHSRCVLTPHDGEFARVFPDLAARLAAPAGPGLAFSKIDAAREAARRAGCIVLLKGADTVVAAPDGRCDVNAALRDRAAPWLATAGSGDVLAGMICGLLARGLSPFEAAGTAAWLHVECARAFGPGLIAEDIPEALPGVFRAMGV